MTLGFLDHQSIGLINANKIELTWVSYLTNFFCFIYRFIELSHFFFLSISNQEFVYHPRKSDLPAS